MGKLRSKDVMGAGIPMPQHQMMLQMKEARVTRAFVNMSAN
jgi:hypothetical protein